MVVFGEERVYLAADFGAGVVDRNIVCVFSWEGDFEVGFDALGIFLGGLGECGVGSFRALRWCGFGGCIE